jgi:hypothetical protein
MNKNIWLPLILVLVLLPLVLGVVYACSRLPASNPGTTQTVTSTSTAPSTTSTNPGTTQTTTPTSTSTIITSTNPGTTQTVTPTSTSITVLDGQTIYNQNCLNCHSSKPQVSTYSQDQLSTFLSGHRSGRNLTAEEISALVALLKP